VKRSAATPARGSTAREVRGASRTPRPPRLGVRAKFWLTLGPRTLFGDGKADLLEAVDRLGSLRRAARSMNMSYRYVWGLLRELDEAAGFAFLEHSGTGARSSLQLTPQGRRFIEAYRRFRAPLGEIVEQRFRRVFRD
jgi:molybdate transport system regulatory protein